MAESRATQVQEGLTTAGPSVEPPTSAPGAPAVDMSAEGDGQHSVQTSVDEGGLIDDDLDVVRQRPSVEPADNRH